MCNTGCLVFLIRQVPKTRVDPSYWVELHKLLGMSEHVTVTVTVM